jgi:hypothetical protein
MGQAPIQEIDVHEGLESTLKILSHKLKSSSITVTREEMSLIRYGPILLITLLMP